MLAVCPGGFPCCPIPCLACPMERSWILQQPNSVGNRQWLRHLLDPSQDASVRRSQLGDPQPQLQGAGTPQIPAGRGVQGGPRQQGCECRRVLAQHPLPCVSP